MFSKLVHKLAEARNWTAQETLGHTPAQLSAILGHSEMPEPMKRDEFQERMKRLQDG